MEVNVEKTVPVSFKEVVDAYAVSTASANGKNATACGKYL